MTKLIAKDAAAVDNSVDNRIECAAPYWSIHFCCTFYLITGGFLVDRSIVRVVRQPNKTQI